MDVFSGSRWSPFNGCSFDTYRCRGHSLYRLLQVDYTEGTRMFLLCGFHANRYGVGGTIVHVDRPPRRSSR